MGTAVLHPQDYLTGLQNDQNRQFMYVSDSPSSVARHAGRPLSAPSIPATERGRDVADGNTVPNRGRGLLSYRNSSSGLLPLPDQALQSAHNTYSRLASKISACRYGEIADSYGSNYSTSSHHSNFSSYASEVRISRRPSVPMLDHAARAQSFLSECFPLHHARRPLPHDSRVFLNSAQGNCMAAPLSCAGGTKISCQKLKALANSHFSDVFNPVLLKRADSVDQSIHYKKRMHPELCQVEVYLGAKPPFKVLPDGQGKSNCTKMNTVGRKFGVNKQLKKSASEKLQGLVLQRPGAKEVTRNLITRSPEGVVGSHTGTNGSSKIEVKLSSSAPPASSLEGKTEKGPRMQVSSDVDTQRRMCLLKAGAARSSQVTSSQQMGCTVRASLHGQCHDSANAAVEHKEVDLAEHKDVNEEDQMTDIAGFVSQDQYDLCKVDVTSAFDKQSVVSNIRKPCTVVAPEGILRSRSSVLDNDEMWASMMNDERWAGPSFFNSPSPSSLPVPSFTFLFSRTLPAGSKPAEIADYGADMVSDKSVLEAKRTWDVAFATKDLRRMLHLDHASCDL